MQNRTRIPSWLIGGVVAWLAYVIILSVLHIQLLNQWGVPFTLQIYTMNASEPLSLTHLLLLGMVAPGFFIIEALSFLHMALLSSLSAILVGALLSTRDRRMNLAGAILGLALLGGSLLFILNRLNAH
jgi:hypothetical protein